MSEDLLQTQPDVPEQQKVLDEFSQETLSAEDQQALDQLQGELNTDRAPVLPVGNARHIDNQGNALTDDENAERQAKREQGETDEYGQGGSRA